MSRIMRSALAELISRPASSTVRCIGRRLQCPLILAACLKPPLRLRIIRNQNAQRMLISAGLQGRVDRVEVRGCSCLSDRGFSRLSPSNRDSTLGRLSRTIYIHDCTCAVPSILDYTNNAVMTLTVGGIGNRWGCFSARLFA